MRIAAASQVSASAWRQLLRVGNVFTAASNVAAGYVIVHGATAPTATLAVLVAASMLLYAAGMALNDAFDAELDARERPERPIPSGRIGRRAAFAAGWSLLALGIALAVVAVWFSGRAAPIAVAGCLAMTIVLYDAGLKNTWAGPWAMGWCRMLNVLLGASASERLASHGPAWLYAAGVGAYAVLLTRLARHETGDRPKQTRRVRRLVTRMIVGFIVIDACAAAIAGGWRWGLAVIALIIPTLLASRRAPMT